MSFRAESWPTGLCDRLRVAYICLYPEGLSWGGGGNVVQFQVLHIWKAEKEVTTRVAVLFVFFSFLFEVLKIHIFLMS